MSEISVPLLELAEEWSPTFKVLGDRTRLKLLIALHYRGPGEAPVGELAEVTGTSFANASKALGNMADSGVITSSRTGREVRYALTDERVHALLHQLGGTHAH